MLRRSAPFLALLVLAVPSKAAAKQDRCRGKLCLTDRYPTKCGQLRPIRAWTAENRLVRCSAIRAARHFGISRADALYVSWRESRWTRTGCNAYSYCGPFQSSLTLWSQTPYRRLGDQRNTARWSALAFGWLSAHGWRCNWSPPAYCG